ARDQREHLARLRVEGDERPAILLESLLGDALQLEIQRDDEVVARLRLGPPQRADRAAAGIDLDLLRAGRAVQLLLVRALDAELADVVGALVVGRAAQALDALHVRVVDAADVADRVRGELALRIRAEHARLDLESGEAEAVHGETRDLLFGEPRLDRQALEVLALFLELAEAAPVARLHVDHRGELVDRAVDVGDPARRDLERVGRVVRREHLAVAVEDDAAVRDDGDHGDAVLLREGVVVLALHHLQPRKPPEQDRERGEDRHDRERQPVAENDDVALGIAKRRADDHDAASLRRRRTADEWRMRLVGPQASAVATGPRKYSRPGK